MEVDLQDVQRRVLALEAQVAGLRRHAIYESGGELPLSSTAIVLGYAKDKEDRVGRQNLRRRIGDHYREGIEVIDIAKPGALRPRWQFDIAACRRRDQEVNKSKLNGN